MVCHSISLKQGMIAIFSLFAVFMSCVPTYGNADEPHRASALPSNQLTNKTPVNLMMYEHRDGQRYETIAYMPFYPAYALISFKSPECSAELTGFIDPFALQKNRVKITYKKCTISFDQQGNSLNHPKETEECQNYHPQTCSFTTMPQLEKVNLQLPE